MSRRKGDGPDYDPFADGASDSKRPDPALDRLVTGGSFVLDEPASTPVIWGTEKSIVWPEGEGLMLCGPQGVGKSTIAQQLALARIGVRPPTVLGLPVRTSAGKVMYIAGDRPRQIARSLRRMVHEDDREELDKRLVVWKGPPPFNVLKDPAALARWAEDNEATTLWLDSYKDLAPGLVQDDVGAVVNIAVQELLARNIEFCGLHHQRKATAENRKPDKLDDVYGSNWLTAGLGSVVLLCARPGGAAVEFVHLKQPEEPVGPFDFIHDHSSGTSRVLHVEADLEELLARAGKDGVTEAQAALALFGSAELAERKKVHRRLMSLVSQGAATHHEGKKGGSGGGGVAARWVAN